MMSFAFVPFTLAMAAPADPNASPWISLLPFAFILGIFYFMVLLPMRRRQKKVADFQASLKMGDKVITTGGIYGTIARLGDASVQLQVSPQVRIEVARAAIGGYQGQEPVVPDSGAA
jgi:preprotein translocase subunit YajC